MSTVPHEIEIKLEGDPAEADALLGSLTQRFGAPVKVQSLVSLYFDTPGTALRAEGLSLRIRGDGTRFVQTVKRGEGVASGLFRRAEWEVEVADGTHPDLHAARQTPVAAVLKAARGALGPAFETRVERRVWMVSHDDAVVEIALDRGTVVAGGRSAPLFELELELKGGPVSALFGLLAEIGGMGALRIGVLAKSDRGFALLADKPPRPAKAEPVALAHGMATASAAQAVLHGCLRQFRRNEALMVEERDPEALHQARVALRRLRSAMSLFKPVLRDGVSDRLASALQQVSRHLGDARNLDVYLAHAPSPVAERPEEREGLATFLADMHQRREAAYDALTATVAGAPFRTTMLDLLGWIEAGPWLTTEDPLRRAARQQPIEVFAASVLATRRRSVKRKGRRLDTLDPAARHRVRIAAKKLRYAAEFVGALATRRKARTRHRAFIAAMEALQGDLGDLNDIQTGHDLALDYAASTPVGADAAALFAAGQATGHGEERGAGLLASAVRHHRAVVDAKPFWGRWSRKPG